MHQVVVSTVDKFNGADRGIRESWATLFDRYGVDLVVCGHEHHYERSHPIRRQASNDTLTPIPVSTCTDTIDTTKGTVHMVIGGGSRSAPSKCAVLHTCSMPGHYRRGPVRPLDQQTPAHLRHRERALAGGPRPRPTLTASRLSTSIPTDSAA